MEGIIDRFENNLALIETSAGMVKVNIKHLPVNAREGDVLKKQGEYWIVDRAATEFGKQKIRKLAQDLWEQD